MNNQSKFILSFLYVMALALPGPVRRQERRVATDASGGDADLFI